MYFAQQLVKESKVVRGLHSSLQAKMWNTAALCYCTRLLGFDQLRPAPFRGLSIISQGFSRTEKT